ncbi:hypothetical protein D7Y24_13435 [Stenotrophomonas maltophilia]|nr:hypothetical protein [Stenotrophomonas maltophilia]
MHLVQMAGSCTLTITYDQGERQFSLALRRNATARQKARGIDGATLTQLTLLPDRLMGIRRDDCGRLLLKAENTLFWVPEKEVEGLNNWLNLLNRLLLASSQSSTDGATQ